LAKIRARILEVPNDLREEPIATISSAWDLFLCRASEDKEDFARLLANRLRHEGMKVWFDEFEIEPSDSISESIERGLANSKLVLSFCRSMR
jgi:TIR domain